MKINYSIVTSFLNEYCEILQDIPKWVRLFLIFI